MDNLPQLIDSNHVFYDCGPMKTEESEEWRSVVCPGLPEVNKIYSVSNFGRVRRDVSAKTASAGKILTSTLIRSGYLGVTLCYQNTRRSISIHRLVALAFIPNPENKPQVNHKNGVKTDNRLENLEWVTASENVIHSFSVLGRKAATGERNGSAKLTKIDVKEILAWSKTGDVTQDALAARWGVSQDAISLIVRRINWSSIAA